jgi:hypothetical protein
MRVYVSFESGLEILAPLENADTPMASLLRKALELRGEGMFAVVHGVSDMMEARAHAVSLGYEPGPLLENLGDEPWLTDVCTFKESVICEFMQTLFVYGEITYPDGIFLTHPEQGPRRSL